MEASDVVKGQSNRLSLRALTVVLADSTSETTARRTRPGMRNRFLTRPVFRELLVFLTLRLFAATDVRASWAAHSVDPVDVPAFFSGYAGPVLPVWLESLSQASNGEYAADAATPVAAHTDAVREALGSHRLLLANHALLLAHLDDLGTLWPDTLLIIDEAHQLEDAATSALTTTVDYRAVEDLFAELEGWVGAARLRPRAGVSARRDREPRHPAGPRASAEGRRHGIRRAWHGHRRGSSARGPSRSLAPTPAPAVWRRCGSSRRCCCVWVGSVRRWSGRSARTGGRTRQRWTSSSSSE